MTRLSSLTVTGTDSGDGAVGTNTFKINWHMPIENIQENGTPVESYNSTPAAVVLGYPSSTNVPNETIQVVVDPSVWNCLLLLSDTQRVAAGTVTFVGGVTLSYLSAGTVPIATNLILRAAAGGTMGGIGRGVAASRQESCVNSLAEWQSAVADTQAASSGSVVHDIRISPSSLAISNSDLRQQMAMTPWVIRRYTAKFTKGDGYDEKGYQGITYGHSDIPQEPKVVGYYELSTSPSNE